MKLSEAMRLGSLLRHQSYYEYFDDTGGSCAIGAAFEAIGIKPRSGDAKAVRDEALNTEDFKEWCRDLRGKTGRGICPVCGYIPENHEITTVIFHLNNDHMWTRQHIADWVEQIENMPCDSAQLVCAIGGQ